MSGQVYKHQENEWVQSTSNNSIDCISSVKMNGTWKEYLGIITSIDLENNCITFASHGDYLFNVSDANTYGIGDVITYDGSIIDEDTPITVKLQHSIIGKVSGIVDDNTIAVFKD